MNKTLLALYGLKFNPFSPELPTEALHITPQVEQFCWRVEHALIREVIADKRIANLAVDVRNGVRDTFAEIARLVAIAQLDRFACSR